MAEAVIVGGGGHARVMLAVLRRLGHRIIGYTAPEASGAGMAAPYLGRDDELPGRVDASAVIAVLGIGKVRVDDRRMRLLEWYLRAGFQFPAIIAPTATVHEEALLGAGTVVLDGAVVVTGSRLGRACIVNTNASIDHDCLLGDDVHVAPGATLCGGVEIEDGCMVGAGATVIDSLRVSAGTLVGAGATVVSDLTRPGTYIGTPARKA